MKKVILLLTMALLVLCMTGSAFAKGVTANDLAPMVSANSLHADQNEHNIGVLNKAVSKNTGGIAAANEKVDKFVNIVKVANATGVAKNADNIANHKGKIARLDERVSLHTDDIIGNMDDIAALEEKGVKHDAVFADHADCIKANADGVTSNTRAVVGHEKRLYFHDVQLDEHDKHIKLNRADIDRNRADIENLYNELDDLEEEMSEGIALSMAMQAPAVSQGKRFALSTGGGTYNGESALAGSVGIRLSENWQVNAAAGAGLRTGKFGARAGITFEY